MKKYTKYILIKGVIENRMGQIVHTENIKECQIYSSDPNVPLTDAIVNKYLDNIVKYTMKSKLENKYEYVFKDNKVFFELGKGEYNSYIVLEVNDEPVLEKLKKEAA